MQKTTFFTFLLSLSFFLVTIGSVRGQSCVPFAGSPATGHKCDAFLNGQNIFLTTSFEEADAAVASVTSTFNAVVPYACREIAMQMTCQSLLPVCAITTTLELRPPCRSVCETMWLECLPFLTSLNVTYLLPDCNMIQIVNGVPLPVFPQDGLYPCLPVATNAAVPYDENDCPYPLTFYPPDFSEENPQGACQLQCPAFIFGSEERFWGSAAALYVTTVPSMLCSFVMSLTWLLNPTKRRYPAVLIVWLSVSALGVSTALNLGVLVGGPKRTVCTWDDDEVAVTMDNAGDNHGQGVVCIIQAIGQYYFGLTCNFWWLAITINIFLMLCFSKSDWVRRFSRYIHIGYHVFCWGVPLAGLIVVLSLKKLGSSGINPFCGIIYQQDESWIDWVFYSAPILFCITLGTILMVISITKFLIVQFRTEKASMSELSHLFRLLALVATVWLNNVFYLAYRIYLEDNWDHVYDSIEEQVVCSLTTQSDCPYTVDLDYPFYIVALIASSSTGVCIFLTMCTTKSTLVLWFRLGKGLLHPRTFFAQARLVVGSHSSSQSVSFTTDNTTGGTNTTEMDNHAL